MVKREEVNILEAVKKQFPKMLIKDLTEHERICPNCNGLGMVIRDNIYGIRGDTSEAGRREHFPYKHQALSFCQFCYNGVQRLCPHCGKPYNNQAIYQCDCDGYKQEQEDKRLTKWKEVISKAKCVDEKSVETMLYSEEFDEYFDCVSDFFDWYCDNYEEDFGRPERLWVTEKVEISVDAANIIESACEKLHEDASENCDEKSLQKLLDDWCKEQYGTTTYCPCYKEYVVIDWDKFDEDIKLDRW